MHAKLVDFWVTFVAKTSVKLGTGVRQSFKVSKLSAGYLRVNEV